MSGPEILVVSLGSTVGLRASDEQLVASLRRAGASVRMAVAAPPRPVRTFALTDLGWALSARRAAARALGAARPAAILYSTTTAALLWPEPGAIRLDAGSAANRPGRHGVWQRPLERRRLAAAPLLVPTDPGALAELSWPLDAAVVVPIAVASSGPADSPRDIAAITYAANPLKKGLDRVLDAWSRARREGEILVVAGVAPEHVLALLPG
ncbi:MAG TPA: hypothetical protein VGN69_03600, partial [Solirubrobacteraceae bacterium]|nr:hypothetical protein [Solirubrobacteraceae bacterium]